VAIKILEVFWLKIPVKIVSGVKQSGIPDTIKMSEAAGQYLWGFN